MEYFFYRNKENGHLFNSDKELTIENFPDWTKEEIKAYERITMDEYLGVNPKQKRLEEIRKRLSETDYVVIKIYEAKIRGEDTIKMEAEYAEVLDERDRIRKEADALIAEIGEAE